MNLADLLQALVALLTVAGLVVTVVYNQRALRTARQATVVSAFLDLNERLQETLYALLERDKEILKQDDLDVLRPHQFRFFRLIDLIADIWEMRPMLEEHDPRLWRRTEARIVRLLAKRSVQTLWRKQVHKNAALFDASFAEFVEAAIRSSAAADGRGQVPSHR